MAQTPPAHVRLEFDRLVSDYIENLNVTLRGFKAVEGIDFLEAFVPSEDPTHSVLDLVEISRDAGLHSLTISLSPKTEQKLDMALLTKASARIQRREVGGEIELDFTLQADSPNG